MLLVLLVLLGSACNHVGAAQHVDADSTIVAGVNVGRMRSELRRACRTGLCARHSNSSSSIKNTTDCHGRLTAYEFGLTLIPLRAPQIESFDALELAGCGVTRPPDTPWPPVKLNVSSRGTTVHVDPSGGTRAPGHFGTILEALKYLRSKPAPRTMILRKGVHFLAQTLELTPADSGLTISADPSGEEEAWISGGALLPQLSWSKVPGDKHGAYVAQLPAGAPPVVAGLQTLSPHTRLTKARYPNGNPELCTSCWNSGMKLWHKNLSCVGKARVVYKNLVDCDEKMKLPDVSPCKNDSGMWTSYNTYSNGHGGCCSPWSGDASPYGPMGNCECWPSPTSSLLSLLQTRSRAHTH
jgi:hypothetical protein